VKVAAFDTAAEHNILVASSLLLGMMDVYLAKPVTIYMYVTYKRAALQTDQCIPNDAADPSIPNWDA
jgi:hypothetical protein